MGTGEAAVTLLSEKGVPTPVVHTRMLAPASKMAPVADVDGPGEGIAAVRQVRHAGRRAERARAARGAAGGGLGACACTCARARQAARAHPGPEAAQARARAPDPGGIGDFLNSRQGKAMQREVMRGVFGMLRKRLSY